MKAKRLVCCMFFLFLFLPFVACTAKTGWLVADRHPTDGPTVVIISPEAGEYILW